MKIGRVTLIDPAVAVKQKNFDLELEKVIAKVFFEPSQFVTLHVAKEAKAIRSALIQLCDEEKCPLVLTFGGILVALAWPDRIAQRRPGGGGQYRLAQGRGAVLPPGPSAEATSRPICTSPSRTRSTG